MQILINVVKSIGIILIAVVLSLIGSMVRGFHAMRNEKSFKILIITAIILGCVGGIFFSLLIVWS